MFSVASLEACTLTGETAYPEGDSALSHACTNRDTIGCCLRGGKTRPCPPWLRDNLGNARWLGRRRNPAVTSSE